MAYTVSRQWRKPVQRRIHLISTVCLIDSELFFRLNKVGFRPMRIAYHTAVDLLTRPTLDTVLVLAEVPTTLDPSLPTIHFPPD